MRNWQVWRQQLRYVPETRVSACPCEQWQIWQADGELQVDGTPVWLHQNQVWGIACRVHVGPVISSLSQHWVSSVCNALIIYKTNPFLCISKAKCITLRSVSWPTKPFVKNSLFVFAPCLPHRLLPDHWDQTTIIFCQSLGSRPIMKQDIFTLVPHLFGTTSLCLSVQPFQLLPLRNIWRYISLTWPFPHRNRHAPGLLMLRKCFLNFAVKHWFGCRATEPDFVGDIGAIEVWLIDWLIGWYKHSWLRYQLFLDLQPVPTVPRWWQNLGISTQMMTHLPTDLWPLPSALSTCHQRIEASQKCC